MKKLIPFIIFTFIFISGLRVNAENYDLLVIPTNIFTVCQNYFCFPEASDIIAKDTIFYLNGYKNIHAKSLNEIRAKLSKNSQLKTQTDAMLTHYKINDKIDFGAVNALSKEFDVKYVAIISTYAVTDKADIRRDLWDVMELSSAFKFTYPFDLKINAVLIDSSGNIVMWSNKYTKALSDSKSMFAVTNQAQAISQLEKINEYSKENVAKNISQNIHLRFFPREVRTFDLVKKEFKNNVAPFTPNALDKLSEPRLRRELEERERHFDYSRGDDLFSF